MQHSSTDTLQSTLPMAVAGEAASENRDVRDEADGGIDSNVDDRDGAVDNVCADDPM